MVKLHNNHRTNELNNSIYFQKILNSQKHTSKITEKMALNLKLFMSSVPYYGFIKEL